MTFEDDMVQLEFAGGRKRTTCNALGLQWPPPEFINVFGFDMMRTGLSQITDEQRAGMTHVIRGAVYEPLPSKLGQTPTVAQQSKQDGAVEPTTQVLEAE